MDEERITRGVVQDLLSKFAAEDPKYREMLIRDPKAVLEKQFNTSLGDLTVKAVVETPDTVYVVVPHVPAEGELGDADLEKVAGGWRDFSGECGTHLDRHAPRRASSYTRYRW